MLNDKYGVTSTGFVKKRLDEIENEMCEMLRNSDMKVDPRDNRKSYLFTLVENFSDKIAELWEVAEQVYQNLYPSTAEGEALDRVAQFGGSRREPSRPASYTILCTGDNETVIPVETTIETETSPAIQLLKQFEEKISISHCKEATLEVVGNINADSEYWIGIDNERSFMVNSSNIEGRHPIKALYDEMSRQDTGLKTTIATADVSFKEKENVLTIAFDDNDEHRISINETLNAKSVTSPLTFVTVAEGDIVIPEGAATKIKTSVSGLKSVINKADHVSGRDRETDTELRNAYSNKIFIRSRTMLESITSAILANVEDVESVSAYQNDTNERRGIPIDSPNRHMPPHSVEVVVVGGEKHDQEIAEIIFATKAAGIQTCHHCGKSAHILEPDEDEDTVPHCYPETIEYARIEQSKREELQKPNGVYCIELEVEDDYGYKVPVRFSRPWEVKFSVTVKPTANIAEFPGTNAQEKIKEIIKENINSLAPGENIQPQKWIHKLYEAIPGISNYEIYLEDTTFVYDEEKEPDEGDNKLNHAHSSDQNKAYVSHGIGYNEVARVEDAGIIIDWQV